MSSPALAPPRSKAIAFGTSPKTVMQMFKGPRVVSPPMRSQWWASANAHMPFENSDNHCGTTWGKANDSKKALG